MSQKEVVAPPRLTPTEDNLAEVVFSSNSEGRSFAERYCELND